MRSLHVAALPFPSPQGTQGLLHAMLCALGSHGHDAHLLCYGYGAPGAPEAPGQYTVHRSAARARSRARRAGPTIEKVWLDAALARELGALTRRLQPDLIVAHHVEAAACTLAQHQAARVSSGLRSLVEARAGARERNDAARAGARERDDAARAGARERNDAARACVRAASPCAARPSPSRASALRSSAVGEPVPFLFVAHTSLRAELPSYFAPVWARCLAVAGRGLDVLLTRWAPRTLAVSPQLAELLSSESGRAVDALPLPWPAPPAYAPGEREQARRTLALGAQHEIALYAGNLDAYQGLSALLPALAHVAAQRRHFRLVFATACDPRPLARELAAHGLATRAAFLPLDDEPARRRAHALADLALVPRRCPGGVPVKLLDALARALPTVAAERALAGFPFASYCRAVASDAPAAWAQALDDVFANLEAARERARQGRAYILRELAPSRFVAALEAHARALSL